MQTKVTHFIDKEDLVSDSDSCQTTDDLGQQLDLFDSKVVVANAIKRKRIK